jgi:hypothetical protein
VLEDGVILKSDACLVRSRRRSGDAAIIAGIAARFARSPG